MRGKGTSLIRELSSRRITPAYAGKSGELYVLFKSMQDHPRLCGEKSFRLVYQNRTKGSPPPMRGKVEFMMNAKCEPRITPAYAGKRQN